MGLFIELLGAIALLILGLRFIKGGIMKSFGASLKRLARMAEGRLLPAFFSGLAVAVLLQSSTATAMITASFAAQGLVSAATAFVTILGADIGTALAVLLASQKITFLAPLFLAVGVFGVVTTTNRKRSGAFKALSGLGMVLLALSLVSSSAEKIAQVEDFAIMLDVFARHPFWMVMLGIGMSYAAHSSFAVLLLTSGFIVSGLLTPAGGLYLVLGANVGSGLLPVVLNWKSKFGARVPVVANLLIRAFGVVIGFFFVEQFLIEFNDHIQLAMVPAVFHLALNIGVVLVGFASHRLWLSMARSVLPPDEEDEGEVQPKFLDRDALDDPDKALACAKREALVMADIAQTMVRNVLPVIIANDDAKRRETMEMDDSLDTLFVALKGYLAQILHKSLDDDESEYALDLLNFTANMEHIGDIVDCNLMAHAGKKAKRQIQFSKEGIDEITELHEAVCTNFDLAVNAFLSEKPELARQLYDAKANVRDIERLSIATHIKRLGTGVTDSIETSGIHLDIVHDLRRINSHLTAIAYPVLKASGEVPKTKWKRQKA